MSQWREGAPTEPGYYWISCVPGKWPNQLSGDLDVARAEPALHGELKVWIETPGSEDGGMPPEYITHHMPIPVPDPPPAGPA